MGGIARFQTLANHYKHDKAYEGQPDLLTFFSGDAFNPSLESSITKGGWWLRRPILRTCWLTGPLKGNI